MRWLALLFTINVVLALWHWSGERQLKAGPKYQVADNVIELSVSPLGSGCLLLGPIFDEGVAQQFDVRLRELNRRVALIKRDREKAPRYWVYYGPFGSYAESLKEHRKFRDEGVDNFIITQEDLYGALSFGVFENIDSAKRMQALMQGRGYRTSIRNIFKFESRWWVEIEAVDRGAISNKINDIQYDLGLALEMREFFCKTVASEKPLP
ncbi:hypothetical protein A3742_19440 [Oleiphilus sp. HI0071]|jgi:hypothetical protein|uniref:SPOR domain-containing protein n=2 Tax=unclassified Oleiphilus TaxID=2631174 RepID=UPI0007C313C7|nr:SPOR domain-containing protein [Oleiphilus sp. HI0079]KZY62127.1 hypothetical protein A3737_20660 [Oleiphilus sp. HI0065]KZY79446.1 hypothetical protein A3742_14240 [Oleiphilus sp. HI0071]KZY92352.1 hypothetical protein A3744_14760 [Oleiphilus sp. HI0073]KZZ42866.1 hypothetical protein A3758_04655 [Oleiphilus sp. HI0118]KZZ53655.1 hypothetical protein A3760_09040 [Oleiphilus sp. HI0122]KZZ72243.1 hypothetical protein A3765_13330 [Oleiphilus sp. HI0130]KZZ78152.1 hypothetical protein A3767